ncbi:MAG: response regulator transcription factor [Bacteroidales bacterium]|nr:response regulator transcription factor [Bacteroidales bacterium]
MNCLIVDDEPLAREILETFTAKVPQLKLISSCQNAFEALEILQKEKIDLVFLDIQMPDLTGIQLYSTLPTKPLVIFTTAYSSYAVTGFELDALDYLVKPFSFERYLKAVNKALELDKKKKEEPVSGSHDFMFVKDGTKLVKVNYNDVLYLEGMKDYVKIVMKDNKFLLTLISMQHMVDKLPERNFVRIHRSYIVSISKIDKVEKNRVVIGSKWIPVGNSYKESLHSVLGRIS